VEGATFFSGREPGSDHSWGQGTGINAGVMLLAPSMADFLTMQEELVEPYHPAHVRGNGPEQDYLSRFFADRPWRHISVENNFQVHHMYNALHPHLDDVERVIVCKNFKTVRIVHFSGDSGVKPWTRCLRKTYGWPNPDGEQDEEYVQQFLADYHSYLLWVKKDPERWKKMERSMFEDSSIKGFSLGEDGSIYFEDENGKVQKEPPPEAIKAVMDATRYFLKSWFDMLKAATEVLKRDLVEDLLSASSSTLSSGDPDPLQASDPWGGPAIQNGKIADHEENNRSTEKAGEADFRQDYADYARESALGGQTDPWQHYAGRARRGDAEQSSIYKTRGSQEAVWNKRNGSKPTGRQQVMPKVRVECITSAEASRILFCVPDGPEEAIMPAQEEQGLFAKDDVRGIRQWPGKEDDLPRLWTFVETVEEGGVVLLAAIGLENEVLGKVLGPFQRNRTPVPKDAKAVAVAGIKGKSFEINYGNLCATACVWTNV